MPLAPAEFSRRMSVTSRLLPFGMSKAVVVLLPLAVRLKLIGVPDADALFALFALFALVVPVVEPWPGLVLPEVVAVVAGPGVEVAASEETVLATLFTALTTGLICFATAFCVAAVICGLTSVNHKSGPIWRPRRQDRPRPCQSSWAEVGPAIWRHRHQPPAGEPRPAALHLAQTHSSPVAAVPLDMAR